MKRCLNCGSSIEEKEIEKRYIFRGEEIYILVKFSYCESCNELICCDSENVIIRKLHKRYAEVNGILSGEEIKFIRINKGLSQVELDEVLGYWRGTTQAAEKGYTLTLDEMEKLKNWLES